MDGGAMDAAQLQRLKLKQNVCDKVLKHLREAGAEGVEDPSFAEELEEHFKRLPTRQAPLFSLFSAPCFRVLALLCFLLLFSSLSYGLF